MQTAANRVPNATELARTQVILIQHWSEMVTEAKADLETAQEQVATLDARATRLYNDAVVLHATLNDAFTEIHAHESLSVRLMGLLDRILGENPALLEHHRAEYVAAINGFNAENPIDLTADEELIDDFL